MGSVTRRSHYVPAAYLQFWDIDGVPNGRNSTLWVTSEKGCMKRSVNNTAIQSWVYSRKNPNEAESYFSEFEADWSKLIKQFLIGKQPKNEIFANLLLLHSAYFLLRNPSIESKGASERIENYKQSIELFWREILLEGQQVSSLNAAAHNMNTIWSSHILPSSTSQFVTSDNPSIYLQKDGEISMIILPITPNWLVLFHKKNIKMVRGKVLINDIMHLNSYVSLNSNREIYSRDEMEESDINSFRKWTDSKLPNNNFYSDTELSIEVVPYPSYGMKFSFIE